MTNRITDILAGLIVIVVFFALGTGACFLLWRLGFLNAAPPPKPVVQDVDRTDESVTYITFEEGLEYVDFAVFPTEGGSGVIVNRYVFICEDNDGRLLFCEPTLTVESLIPPKE